MNDDRRREVVDATLEALRHTVGRDDHMPFLKRLVEGQIGPVTFAEIADGLASVDVSGHDPEWREVWQIQSGGRSGTVAEGLGGAAAVKRPQSASSAAAS